MGQLPTQAGGSPASWRSLHMSHFCITPVVGLSWGAPYGQAHWLPQSPQQATGIHLPSFRVAGWTASAFFRPKRRVFAEATIAPKAALHLRNARRERPVRPAGTPAPFFWVMVRSTPYGAEWVRFQAMRESCPSRRTLACWIRLNSLLPRLGAPPVHPFGGAGIPGWGEPGIARSRDGRGPMSWDRPVLAWVGGGRDVSRPLTAPGSSVRRRSRR